MPRIQTPVSFPPLPINSPTYKGHRLECIRCGQGYFAACYDEAIQDLPTCVACLTNLMFSDGVEVCPLGLQE